MQGEMPLNGRITRMLAALRDPASLLRLSGPDLDLTLRLLRRARLLGLVAHRLAAEQLAQFPQRVVDQLMSARNMVDARVRLVRWELRQLARALQPRTRPVVVRRVALSVAWLAACHRPLLTESICWCLKPSSARWKPNA